MMRSRSTLPILLALMCGACDHQINEKQATASGQEIFELCTSCHGEQGQGNAEFNAPAIAGLPEWYVKSALHKFRGGVRGTHPADLTGMQMRPMALSFHNEADLEAAAAYVSGMPAVDPGPTLEGGNAQAGQAHYAVCSACHGPDGAGNQALKAPPLNRASDWYLARQLHKFKSGVRGTNPKDVEGAQMRPNAVALDDQAIKDVVAHIMTLK
jgi:cytochrome c553